MDFSRGKPNDVRNFVHKKVFGVIKKIGKGVGSVVKTAAPFASFIPGVGPLIGGALSKIPGLKNVPKGLGDLFPGSEEGGRGGIFGTGIDLSDILQGGGAAFSALQAGKAASRAGRLEQEALDLARQGFAERAPLRSAAIEGLTSAFPLDRPDLGNIFAGSSNPFARSAGKEMIERIEPPTAPITGGGIGQGLGRLTTGLRSRPGGQVPAGGPNVGIGRGFISKSLRSARARARGAR